MSSRRLADAHEVEATKSLKKVKQEELLDLQEAIEGLRETKEVQLRDVQGLEREVTNARRARDQINSDLEWSQTKLRKSTEAKRQAEVMKNRYEARVVILENELEELRQKAQVAQGAHPDHEERGVIPDSAEQTFLEPSEEQAAEQLVSDDLHQHDAEEQHSRWDEAEEALVEEDNMQQIHIKQGIENRIEEMADEYRKNHEAHAVELVSAHARASRYQEQLHHQGEIIQRLRVFKANVENAFEAFTEADDRTEAEHQFDANNQNVDDEQSERADADVEHDLRLMIRSSSHNPIQEEEVPHRSSNPPEISPLISERHVGNRTVAPDSNSDTDSSLSILGRRRQRTTSERYMSNQTVASNSDSDADSILSCIQMERQQHIAREEDFDSSSAAVSQEAEDQDADSPTKSRTTSQTYHRTRKRAASTTILTTSASSRQKYKETLSSSPEPEPGIQAELLQLPPPARTSMCPPGCLDLKIKARNPTPLFWDFHHSKSHLAAPPTSVLNALQSLINLDLEGTYGSSSGSGSGDGGGTRYLLARSPQSSTPLRDKCFACAFSSPPNTQGEEETTTIVCEWNYHEYEACGNCARSDSLCVILMKKDVLRLLPRPERKREIGKKGKGKGATEWWMKV